MVLDFVATLVVNIAPNNINIHLNFSGLFDWFIYCQLFFKILVKFFSQNVQLIGHRLIKILYWELDDLYWYHLLYYNVFLVNPFSPISCHPLVNLPWKYKKTWVWKNRGRQTSCNCFFNSILGCPLSLLKSFGSSCFCCSFFTKRWPQIKTITVLIPFLIKKIKGRKSSLLSHVD